MEKVTSVVRSIKCERQGASTFTIVECHGGQDHQQNANDALNVQVVFVDVVEYSVVHILYNYVVHIEL